MPLKTDSRSPTRPIVCCMVTMPVHSLTYWMYPRSVSSSCASGLAATVPHTEL